jgi:hypothetical protein
MAPKQERNAFERFLDNLKIGYINGKNPIGRAQTDHGFFTTKNGALNLPKLLMNIPYDPELRIKKGDPAAELRANTLRIGQIERIHNTYIKGRVKLAD